MLLSDPEWLGRPSQDPQALRHRCLRHLKRLRRAVPLIQAIGEAQEKSGTGPAQRTFADGQAQGGRVHLLEGTCVDGSMMVVSKHRAREGELR